MKGSLRPSNGDRNNRKPTTRLGWRQYAARHLAWRAFSRLFLDLFSLWRKPGAGALRNAVLPNRVKAHCNRL
jgi:hypothetical protein